MRTGSASAHGTAGSSSRARPATRCRPSRSNWHDWRGRWTAPPSSSASTTAGSHGAPAKWWSGCSTVSPMPDLQDHVVIRTTGLTKVYPGDLTAVDHLDLAVHDGEIFGLLGP